MHKHYFSANYQTHSSIVNTYFPWNEVTSPAEIAQFQKLRTKSGCVINQLCGSIQADGFFRDVMEVASSGYKIHGLSVSVVLYFSYKAHWGVSYAKWSPPCVFIKLTNILLMLTIRDTACSSCRFYHSHCPSLRKETHFLWSRYLWTLFCNTGISLYDPIL